MNKVYVHNDCVFVSIFFARVCAVLITIRQRNSLAKHVRIAEIHANANDSACIFVCSFGDFVQRYFRRSFSRFANKAYREILVMAMRSYAPVDSAKRASAKRSECARRYQRDLDCCDDHGQFEKLCG